MPIMNDTSWVKQWSKQLYQIFTLQFAMLWAFESGTLSLIVIPPDWHWALIWIQEGNVKDVWCLNDCQLLLNDDTGICRLSTSHTWHHLLAANVFLSSSGPGPSHQGVLQGPHFRPHFSQPTSQSLKVKRFQVNLSLTLTQVKLVSRYSGSVVCL